MLTRTKTVRTQDEKNELEKMFESDDLKIISIEFENESSLDEPVYASLIAHTNKFDMRIKNQDTSVSIYLPHIDADIYNKYLRGTKLEFAVKKCEGEEHAMLSSELDDLNIDRKNLDCSQGIGTKSVFKLASCIYGYLKDSISGLKINSINASTFSPIFYTRRSSERQKLADNIIDVLHLSPIREERKNIFSSTSFDLKEYSYNRGLMKIVFLSFIDQFSSECSQDISAYSNSLHAPFVSLSDFIAAMSEYIEVDACLADVLSYSQANAIQSQINRLLRLDPSRYESLFYTGLKRKSIYEPLPDAFYKRLEIDSNLFHGYAFCDDSGNAFFKFDRNGISDMHIIEIPNNGTASPFIQSCYAALSSASIQESSFDVSCGCVHDYVAMVSDALEGYVRKCSCDDIQSESESGAPSDSETMISKKDLLSKEDAAIMEIFLDHGMDLRKMAKLEEFSMDSPVIRNIITLPWWQVKQPESDFKKITDSINKSHYGLDQVKKRILEFIAVQNRSDSSEGTILCLVGPAGVGKSTIAESIAQALGLEFAKVSMNGVSSNETIKGFDRSWRGSQPGIFIQAMQKCETMNPVMLIDEIDKMDTSRRNLFDSLVDLLDPNQNSHFSDVYIQADYDMSKVTFIITANSLDNVPYYLLDRMEIIEIGSYSDNEKKEIGERYIVPKLREKYKLSCDECVLSHSDIQYIIQKYTNDCGVRSLERSLRKIYQNYAYDVAQSGTNEAMGIDNMKLYIDKVLYDCRIENSNMTEAPSVGVVYGLCVKGNGSGDILPMEAIIRESLDGQGGISLTGNLMDTIKESANVAYNYVIKNRKKFGIQEDFIKRNTICINCPDGIRKDGPSAGVTFATLILSVLLNKKIDNTVAMTGEISLNGYVMPIGGLREKIFAAYRNGKTTVFCPKANESDLDTVPHEILEKVNVIPVATYDEIFRNIFYESEIRSIQEDMILGFENIGSGM